MFYERHITYYLFIRLWYGYHLALISLLAYIQTKTDQLLYFLHSWPNVLLLRMI